MNSINIGLLGCGRVAEWQAGFFKDKLANTRVRVVCDLVAEKARKLGKLLGAKWTQDLDEVLGDGGIDMLSIMTESGHHYEHSKKTLAAGKHVLVEKPPCMLAEQVIELADTARNANLMFAPIFQNRFNPAMQALKQAIEQERFGRIVCVSVRLLWCRYQEYYEDGWHGTWGLDGGVINQQAIHHVDALNWLCGPVSDVMSFQANRLNVLEAEDTNAVALRLHNGGLGTIQATTAARPDDKEASLTLVGEKGTVAIGGIALNLINTWEFTEPLEDDAFIPDRYSTEVPCGYGLSHGPFIQEVVDRTLAGRLDGPVSAESAAQTVRLIHAIYRSAEEGKVARVSDNLNSQRLGRAGTKPYDHSP